MGTTSEEDMEGFISPPSVYSLTKMAIGTKENHHSTSKQTDNLNPIRHYFKNPSSFYSKGTTGISGHRTETTDGQCWSGWGNYTTPLPQSTDRKLVIRFK